jgi:hypothetical protein
MQALFKPRGTGSFRTKHFRLGSTRGRGPTADGGGDGVDEHDLAVFNPKIVGISVHELGKHLGADGFANDYAADGCVRSDGGVVPHKGAVFLVGVVAPIEQLSCLENPPS